MLLQLEIKHYTDLILSNAKRMGDEHRYDATRLKQQLTDAILMLEGFENHLLALSLSQSKETLANLVEVRRQVVDLDDYISSQHYFNNKEVQEQFSYLLRTLSALRAKLHLRIMQGMQGSQTPEEIKTALSRLSRTAMLHKDRGHV